MGRGVLAETGLVERLPFAAVFQEIPDPLGDLTIGNRLPMAPQRMRLGLSYRQQRFENLPNLLKTVFHDADLLVRTRLLHGTAESILASSHHPVVRLGTGLLG